MRYYPAFLDLEDRPVVVVGGGEAAVRKAGLVARAGARVRLIALKLEADLQLPSSGGVIERVSRGWRASDFAEASLVIAATGDRAEDARVAEAATAANVLVNAVDQPDVSTFTTPAIVERGDVVIGISTGGAAPALARRVRSAIERALPQGLGALAAFAREFRRPVNERVPDFEARRRLWDRIFDGPARLALEIGDDAAARGHLERALADTGTPDRGIVHLVGAGPGDPELLTLKAARLIERADVIVHDRLVGRGVLELARRDARLIAVGKGGGAPSWPQKAINRLLLSEAQAGRIVVRLKGGDPYLFGRGGEEAEFLRHQDVAVSVVPGITAALGCGASAGIPLTHRDHVASATFVTGHRAADAAAIDWTALARLGGTIVFYMGTVAAAEISSNLRGAGVAPDKPVAVIERGTLPEERVFRGTLATLPAMVATHNVRPPALIVVGDVAALSQNQFAAAAGPNLAVAV